MRRTKLHQTSVQTGTKTGTKGSTPVAMTFGEKISQGLLKWRLFLYAAAAQILEPRFGPDKSFERNRCRFRPTLVLSRFQISKGKSACRYQSLSTRRLGPATSLLSIESRGLHGRVCFRWSRRQGEVERRATPAVAVGPDPSAMRFDDRLADCQAHAAA